MRLAIGIAIIVVAVAAIVLVAVRSRRSRSERSDWLGELSEIRRSSLGDDEEVTGAIEAVTIRDAASIDERDATAGDDGGPVVPEAGPVDDQGVPASSEDAGPVEVTPEPGVDPDGDPAGEPGGDDDPVDADAEAVDDADATALTIDPTRTVSDAGTLFNEYDTGGDGRVRIQVTDPGGLRVVRIATSDDHGPGVAIDLRRGVLWFHAGATAPRIGCSVRVPAGWVTADGLVAILAEDEGWSYVMCLAGTASIRSRSADAPLRLVAGQIGRLHEAVSEVDVVDVGVEALESEGMVRRQRRLDAARDERRQL